MPDPQPYGPPNPYMTEDELKRFVASNQNARPTVPQLHAVPPAPDVTTPAKTVPILPGAGTAPMPVKPPESFGQRVLGGLKKAGNIALDVAAPSIAANIPGTDINKKFEENRQARLAEETGRGNLEKAQAQGIEQGNQSVSFTPYGSTEPVQIPYKSLGPVLSAEERARATQTHNAPALAKLGMKYDANGNIVPMEENEISPELQQQRAFQQAVTDYKKAQTALANSKNDPNSAAYKLEAAKAEEARERTMQAMQALGLHQQEFANKVQEQDLIKPSGQTQSRASAAQSVLDVMPELAQMVQKNAAQMGPLMGRLNRGEIAIGDVDPEVAKLYAAIKSFYALQPAVHGFRNAEFVKDFETAMGTLERDPAAFLAGMEGLKPTLESVAKEGRTYHHRIIDNSGNNPPNNTPSQNPPSFADWKKGQQH